MAEKLEDILTRFGDKIAGDSQEDTAGQGAKPLLPDRHPVRDFSSTLATQLEQRPGMVMVLLTGMVLAMLVAGAAATWRAALDAC